MTIPQHQRPTPGPSAGRPSAAEARAPRRVLLLLTATLVPVVAALIAGAVVLWPHSSTGNLSVRGVTGDAPGTRYVTGQVVTVVPFDCIGVGGRPGINVRCAHLATRVASGPDTGRRVQVDVDPTVVKFGIHPGDELQLARFRTTDGKPAFYVFNDFTRSTPLMALAVAFAVLVIAVAHLRGLAALVGLALSFAVLLKFVIPALLSGENPLAVGVVGCAAIMFVLLYLAHGVSIRTTTALVGTLFGLGASAVLGGWAVGAAHLTGVASEEDLTVAGVAGQVRLSGLLLCGIVVASLGILNDVTVTQASAVWELHALASRVVGGQVVRRRDAHRARPHRLDRVHDRVRLRWRRATRPAPHQPVPTAARHRPDRGGARRGDHPHPGRLHRTGAVRPADHRGRGGARPVRAQCGAGGAGPARGGHGVGVVSR